MKYYYSKGGQPVGPMTRAELDALVADGTITVQSHVYKKGSASWVRYHELAAAEPVAAAQPAPVANKPAEAEVKEEPAAAESAAEPVTQTVAQPAPQPVAQPTPQPVAQPAPQPAPWPTPQPATQPAPWPMPQYAPQYAAPASSNGGFLKFVSYNKWVDGLLSRIFKLPRWFGDTEEALHEKINLVASITAFVSWIVLVLCAIGMMDAVAILIALFGGALIQYVVYLICSMLAALLKGPRVVLSSMAAPRLVGYLAVLSAVAYLIASGYMVYLELYGAILAALGLMGVSVVTAYVCFNADKLIVDVKPKESNPGRDFNNLLKFLLRCWATVQFLLAPVIMIIASISNLIFQIQIAIKESELENLQYGWLAFSALRPLRQMADITLCVAVFTPLAIWLIYSLISWLLDLYDGVFSLGNISRKEKEQG